jgi:hypothetical protein
MKNSSKQYQDKNAKKKAAKQYQDEIDMNRERIKLNSSNKKSEKATTENLRNQNQL